MKRATLIVLGALATAAPARADDAPLPSVLAEAKSGMLYGADDRLFELQADLLITGEPVPVTWHGGRGFVALGARAAIGGISDDHQLPDPMAPEPGATKPAAAGRWHLGPELRVGLMWTRWRWPAYVYLGGGLALSSTRAATPTDAPWIAGLGHHRGSRVAVGAAVWHLVLGATWDHAAGLDRVGFAFGAAL